MKQNLIRAAVAGVAGAAIGSLALFITYVTWIVEPGTPRAGVVGVSVFLGGVAGVAVAVMTFVWTQYPRSGRRAAIFATGGCIVLSGIGIYASLDEGEPIQVGTHVFLWMLVWPIAFVLSAWVDVKHFMARQVADTVVEQVKRRQK